MSLIIPAKSHPEVIVQAVAARDRSKAEAFAKSHGIPEVRDSYQGQCSYQYGNLLAANKD
jgi:predicted dehydrogenase